MLYEIFAVTGQILSIYSLIIMIRGLISVLINLGFPIRNNNISKKFIYKITEPYLKLFRVKFLNIGKFDLSYIIALLVLKIIEYLAPNIYYASLGHREINYTALIEAIHNKEVSRLLFFPRLRKVHVFFYGWTYGSGKYFL